MGATAKAPGGGNKWIKLAIVTGFGGALIAFFALGGHKYLTLETIKANRDALLAFASERLILTVAIAFVVYVLAVMCSLPGALLLSLTCGFLFGRWLGTVVIVCAATLGATIVFIAARYLIADWARSRLGGVGQKINEGFSENAFSYMLFLRLVPAFPFFLVNLAPAFTNIRLSTYVGATAIGIIPGSFVFANLGETLATIDSLSGLVSIETLVAFALLGVLALVPVVIKKVKSRKARPA
jgi:uncharacterized membrane protein YdjX (TVP38/TMEM64 family)